MWVAVEQPINVLFKHTCEDVTDKTSLYNN